jgi:hypothetical protein
MSDAQRIVLDILGKLDAHGHGLVRKRTVRSASGSLQFKDNDGATVFLGQRAF